MTGHNLDANNHVLTDGGINHSHFITTINNSESEVSKRWR